MLSGAEHGDTLPAAPPARGAGALLKPSISLSFGGREAQALAHDVAANGP
jgi:hypothetical protein